MNPSCFVGLLCLASSLLVTQASPPSSRIVLTNRHADFRVLYQPGATNELAIGAGLRTDDEFVNYPPEAVLLVVAERANIKHPDNPLGLQSGLPAGTPFGEEGDPLWILPQTQDTDLLYLGFSSEDKPTGTLPPGVFADRLSFRLKSVKGPGDFFAWQADEIGNLLIKFNTKDGVNEDDTTSPPLNSHEHLNFGFTTHGFYEVTFEVTGRKAGTATNIVSAPATFLFAVEPVPILPHQLSTPRIEGSGTAVMDLTGVPGSRYAIEQSSNLRDWHPVAEREAAVDPVAVAVPVTADDSPLFWRAIPLIPTLP